jgi:thioredoxin-like negative regulator of GroEL
LKGCQSYSRLWQSAGFTSKTKSNIGKGIAFDVTDENWTKLVVEESKKTPVILDCWAKCVKNSTKT